jgi:hypothetical protein
MPFELKLNDGICKAFKDENDVDIFVNKGFDEDTNAHFLIVYIPKDEKLGVTQLMNPIQYPSEKDRDDAFENNINDTFANEFYKAVVNHVNENRLKQTEDKQ